MIMDKRNRLKFQLWHFPLGLVIRWSGFMTKNMIPHFVCCFQAQERMWEGRRELPSCCNLFKIKLRTILELFKQWNLTVLVSAVYAVSPLPHLLTFKTVMQIYDVQNVLKEDYCSAATWLFHKGFNCFLFNSSKLKSFQHMAVKQKTLTWSSFRCSH